MATRLTLGDDAVADLDEFIYTLVVWGQHPYDKARRWSIEQMKSEIPEYAEMRESVRRGQAVKWFENLVGSTWQVESSVSGTRVLNPITGESSSLAGSGVLEMSTYLARFTTAVEAWHRTVERCNPPDLLSAVGDAVAAIEAYVNNKAREWTAMNPLDPLTDTRRQSTSLRRKLEEWIPHMTSGKRIDPHSPFWEDYLEMQRYRNEAIHSRTSVTAIDLRDLASSLNKFTAGLAIPLFQLHTFFRESIPSLIIRAAYAPEVRVVAEPAG